MPTKIEKDEISGHETTGHEWDGIKELNTPLPRWWLYVFILTIIWSLIYWVLYPSIPFGNSYFPGILKYSARRDVDASIISAATDQARFVDRIRAATHEEIRADPALAEFSVAGGRSAFLNNCAPCHGSGAQGGKGFPNLIDDVWLWGGTLTDIHTTINYGIRNANPNSRSGRMPALGNDKILTPAEIDDAAEFVLSLTNRSKDEAARLRGAQTFANICAGCHGPTGSGKQDEGAPPLNTSIWLYGGDKQTIIETITGGRGGVMPAWGERLDPAVIKMLTVYVYQLGGGK